MSIQTEKLDLIEWISRINDASIIEKLKSLKEEYSNSKDWWDHLEEEEKASIERGLEDIEKGRVHSHEAARKLYERFL